MQVARKIVDLMLTLDLFTSHSALAAIYRRINDVSASLLSIFTRLLKVVGKPEWWVKATSNRVCATQLNCLYGRLQDAQSNYFALGKLNYNNSLHRESFYCPCTGFQHRRN